MMNKGYIILWFSLFLVSSVSYGQEESEPADTVIIVKDPVIVRKQIIAPEVKPVVTKKASSWKGEIFFLGGLPSIGYSQVDQIKANPVWNGGILLSHIFKRVEFTVGAAVSNGGFTYSKGNKTVERTSFDSSYTVLLDSYIQTIGGKDTTIYISEVRDTVGTKTIVLWSSIQGAVNYTYLQIPIGIGYTFNLWNDRLQLIPRLLFMPGVITFQSANGWEAPKTWTTGYAAQLNVQYFFNSTVGVSLKGQWESGIQSPYSGLSVQSVSYGGGFVVKF